MNLLIPYVPLYNHKDPILEEFTYGDVKHRARKMKNDLKTGDYIFFHTSINGKKYITAYYVVDRVLDTSEAVKNRNIISKYRNPYLKEGLRGEREDVIVFGDPILSRKLERPLLFDQNLARKLSLSIKFNKKFIETQCIGSATRQWRELNENDVKILLEEIELNENKGFVVDTILSTDEVTEIIEKDIENFIETNSKILGESLKLTKRQYDTPVGRIDMIFEDKQGKTIIVVELKLDKIGRKAIDQLKRYMGHIEKETKKEVKGILVCKGIMHVFEEELKNLKKLRFLDMVGSWRLYLYSQLNHNFKFGQQLLHLKYKLPCSFKRGLCILFLNAFSHVVLES